MDILRMLEDLEATAVDAPKGFGPLLWNYNRDEVQMQIHKIRASLPLEMTQAANLTRESERVIEQAREDASKTIEGAKKESERLIEEAKKEIERLMHEAKLQQERLLAENEILKLAKAQADEIRGEADEEACALRRGAEDYAYSVLSQLESLVGKVATTIDRGKSEIRPSQDLALVQPKEKVKVS